MNSLLILYYYVNMFPIIYYINKSAIYCYVFFFFFSPLIRIL